jgi:uncharacterized protein YkwD
MKASIRLAVILLLAALFSPQSALADSPRPVLAEPARMPERPSGLALNGAPVLQDTFCSPGDLCVYLPVISMAKTGIRSREYALNLYNSAYLGSAGVPSAWSGSVAGCNPGTTSQAFRDSVLLRLNYFREMAGIPQLTGFRSEFNTQDQAAALMMAANQALNHTPPTNWKCYTQSGYDGASSSNLALGAYGPEAIDLYMNDGGVGSLGHRRWVLYPQTQEMGTGDILGGSWQYVSNALKAWDSHVWDTRPATLDAFVAWPPPGFVPYQVVYALWSFSVAEADFSSSTVTVTSNGANIPTTLSRPDNGYGENTLAFKPCNCSSWPRPAADTAYQVTIRHVLIDGTSQDFSYTVTVFAP